MKLAAVLLCGLALPVTAQDIHFDTPSARPAARQHVELLTDSFTMEAGKPQEIDLRFHVGNGLHINSHTPTDELLLPTILKFDASDVAVLGETFPPGKPFHLNIGAGEALDVYQDEFRVALHVRVPRGEHTLAGVLRYQACDTASCFPPRTLPLRIAITAR